MSEDKKKTSAPKKPRLTPADKTVVKKALVAYKEVVNGYAEHPEFNKADALANIDRITEFFK